MSAAFTSDVLREEFFSQLDTPGMEKNAQNAITAFVRTRARDDGLYRKIIPMIKVENEDLNIQVDTDKPVIVCEMEPGSPAAITVPFGTLPVSFYIYGKRFRVEFCRVLTPRFTKEIAELRTYRMDIRQIMSDNSVKDMLSEEDSRFFTAVNTALVGADVVVPASGIIQWETVFGGISRDTVEEVLKIIPKTPAHFETQTIVCNNVTVREPLKWGYDEAGGDLSGDFLKNGWSEIRMCNVDWLVTIKRHIVPDDTFYMFAAPDTIGKSFVLDEPTMYVKREAFIIEWFLYETIGGAIAQPNGLARVDFA